MKLYTTLAFPFFKVLTLPGQAEEDTGDRDHHSHDGLYSRKLVKPRPHGHDPEDHDPEAQYNEADHSPSSRAAMTAIMIGVLSSFPTMMSWACFGSEAL